MEAVRLVGFGGEVPGVEPRNIPNNAAIEAINVRLTSGRLDPVYQDGAVATCRSGAQSIHRLLDGTWLSWTADVDVALSPIAGDTGHKFFFTSDAFEPRVSNSAMATGATPPASWYVLGVTPPVTAPTVSPTGGSGTLESRAYVYTFVTQWGEESAPSPASSIASGYPDATWAISGMDTAPPNSYAISAASWSGGTLSLTFDSVFGLRVGEYITVTGLAPASLNTSMQVASVNTGTGVVGFTISNPGTITDQIGTATRDAPHNTTGMTKRVYRSVTTDTDTQFYFTKEIAVATTSTNDDVGANIGEVLPTTGWLMPPVNLRGITTLPSGALVGFYDNVVCFSEPNIPYAWPSAYRNTTDYSVVGLGTISTMVVVGTAGTPYTLQGVEPASASMMRIDQMWPCMAKRGIVSCNGGVYYPTSVGLAFISPAGASIATDGLYSQYEWMDLSPASFRAATFNGAYYTTQTARNVTRILVITPGRWVTEYNFNTGELYTDAATGRIYYVAGAEVFELEPTGGRSMAFTWRSKTFVASTPVNLGAAKIDGVFAVTDAERAAIAAANAALAATYFADESGAVNGAELNAIAVNGQLIDYLPVPEEALQFTLIVDDEVFFSKDVSTPKVFRLPGGRKYDNFSIRVSGNLPIKAILIGPTADSLRGA